ncbi:hypothetical protein [Rhizobium sp. 18065]|uniref:hypothetical protein n=1 Tax=Rhizobium sp. 18065 TaxID=2681411 RepID=UPI00135CC0DA|nr:hypothetical protein [Rhizobium sp. 18065]
MRVQQQSHTYFHGTHKGATIEIERVHDFHDHHFYIRVRWKDGGHLYDGYSPAGITTMAEAKRDAVRGACLDEVQP